MTDTSLQPGPVCGVCPLFHTCNAVCDPVAKLLPSMERGRVDSEDLPRLHMGVRLTNAILDHDHILTERQREVVRLYYREAQLQHQIAERLGITQQAVNDSLKRARLAVGKFIREDFAGLDLLSKGGSQAKTPSTSSATAAGATSTNTAATNATSTSSGSATSHRRL